MIIFPYQKYQYSRNEKHNAFSGKFENYYYGKRKIDNKILSNNMIIISKEEFESAYNIYLTNTNNYELGTTTKTN